MSEVSEVKNDSEVKDDSELTDDSEAKENSEVKEDVSEAGQQSAAKTKMPEGPSSRRKFVSKIVLILCFISVMWGLFHDWYGIDPAWVLQSLGFVAKPDHGIEITQVIGFGATIQLKQYVNETKTTYEKAYGATLGIFNITEDTYESKCTVNSSAVDDGTGDGVSITFVVKTVASKAKPISAQATAFNSEVMVANINAIMKENDERQSRQLTAKVAEMMAGIANIKTKTTHPNGTIEEKIEYPNGGETVVNIYPGGVGYVEDTDEDDEETEPELSQPQISMAPPTLPESTSSATVDATPPLEPPAQQEL